MGWALGVVGHTPVVEEQADVAVRALEDCGDPIAGRSLEDADGEAAQRGDLRGALAGAEGGAIRIPVPVEDVVTAILDAPVGAVEGEQGGELALGQQSIGSESVAGEFERFEEGDDGADLVALLDRIAVADGEGANFCWV